MLLLYGMCEPGASLPPTGLRDAPLRSVSDSGLTLYYSAFTPDSNSVKDDALAFHRVNSAVFNQHAIIPFRFPTTVTDEAAVRDFLAKHADEYRAELERLRDYVQMDVILSEQREQQVAATSGTDYLKHRQSEMHATEALLKQIQSAPAAKEWKQSRRPGTIKLSALVRRGEESAFQQQVAQKGARVTGPWPPAAFVNCYPETE